MSLLPAVLAGLVIGSQILWVLVSGATRDALTVLGVVAFCASSLAHALLTRGGAWTTRFFVIALGFGWAVEAVGTATGIPFGEYEYGTRLGPALVGVPLVIPLAWAMMAYPCFVVAGRATVTLRTHVLLAAVTLAAWDLFLDPQMVAEGHWVFAHPDPTLPGVPGTPLVNYLGWLLAALLLMALLAILVPGRRAASAAPVGVPGVLLGWVYCSSVLANAVFWGRPAVAVAGGIGMGIPLAIMAVRVSGGTPANGTWGA